MHIFYAGLDNCGRPPFGHAPRCGFARQIRYVDEIDRRLAVDDVAGALVLGVEVAVGALSYIGARDTWPVRLIMSE